MKNLSRRDFLVFSATAGLTAFSETLALAKPPLRTGVIGGSNDLDTLHILSSLSELNVAALSDAQHSSLFIASEVVRSRSGVAPVLYPNPADMIREHQLDVVAAFGPVEPPLRDMPLLLDHHTDPLTRAGCVQILPRLEFVGAARSTAAEFDNYQWTKAIIRHRTALPATRVSSAQELHRWMWSEIGDALDFAAEALDVHTDPAIQASAAYGSPAGTVFFAIRLHYPGPAERSIEIGIHARPEDPAPPCKTEIALSHSSGSLLFRAQPRSGHVTRVLVRNLLGAIVSREPAGLICSPQSLRPSRELLTSVAEFIGHHQHLTKDIT
jgi:hypothetical protein